MAWSEIMLCRFLPRFLLLFALCCSATAVLALDTDPAAERLQIVERPLEQNLVFNLSGDDWRWLGKKRVLRLGTVAPDHPPFDFSDSHQDFDGLTADYVALLAKQMGLIVEVVRYPTREAANMALVKGNIDILGNSIQSDLAGQDFVLSRPYAVNRTAIVVPIGKHKIASRSCTIFIRLPLSSPIQTSAGRSWGYCMARPTFSWATPSAPAS